MGTKINLFGTFGNLAGADIPTDREMDGVDLGSILFDDGRSARNAVYYYLGFIWFVSGPVKHIL